MKISLAISDLLPAERLVKVPKQPSLQWLKANAKKINKACEYAEAWYGNPSKKEKAKFEESIALFTKMFGFVPYKGKLYRMQAMGKSFAEKAKEGQTYTVLNKPFQELTSWTTDRETAQAFFDKMFGDYDDEDDSLNCIFQLKSPAVQIMNTRWLWSCAHYLEKLNASDILDADAIDDLLETAKDYSTTEDEVVLKVGNFTEVKLVQIVGHDANEHDTEEEEIAENSIRRKKLPQAPGWVDLYNYYYNLTPVQREKRNLL